MDEGRPIGSRSRLRLKHPTFWRALGLAASLALSSCGDCEREVVFGEFCLPRPAPAHRLFVFQLLQVGCYSACVASCSTRVANCVVAGLTQGDYNVTINGQPVGPLYARSVASASLQCSVPEPPTPPSSGSETSAASRFAPVDPDW
jgi:hypothetical protein